MIGGYPHFRKPPYIYIYIHTWTYSGPCSGCLEDLDVKEDCVTFLANGERALRQRPVCNLGEFAPFWILFWHLSGWRIICEFVEHIAWYIAIVDRSQQRSNGHHIEVYRICSFWVYIWGGCIMLGEPDSGWQTVLAVDLKDTASQFLGRNPTGSVLRPFPLPAFANSSSDFGRDF